MDWKYLLGILGAVAAWVSSVITWYKAQKTQQSLSEYNRKEGLYRELLRSLTVFYKGGDPTAMPTYLEQFRLAWLYAPDEVVRTLNSLADILKTNPEAERLMSQDQQAQLKRDRDTQGAQQIARLVAAIRTDLFKTAGKATTLSAAEFRHFV